MSPAAESAYNVLALSDDLAIMRTKGVRKAMTDASGVPLTPAQRAALTRPGRFTIIGVRPQTVRCLIRAGILTPETLRLTARGRVLRTNLLKRQSQPPKVRPAPKEADQKEVRAVVRKPGRRIVLDITPAVFLELADRCAAQAAPNRMLDWEIAEAMGNKAFAHGVWPPFVPNTNADHMIPHYTWSMDAMSTLAPEGYDFRVERFGYRRARAWCWKRDHEDQVEMCAEAASPPFALGSACLRAQARVRAET